ncbi:MAG: hypothetical protein KatS3mg019_1038 [Fimbriimonadales bacterium]|nr:MAG: hypothetical protein KatS3mg019_1038 [Fimbriimonadales bacterium]
MMPLLSMLLGSIWLVCANADDPCTTCEPVSSEIHREKVECGVGIFTIANENCEGGLPYFENRWHTVEISVFNPTPDTDPACACSFLNPLAGFRVAVYTE